MEATTKKEDSVRLHVRTEMLVPTILWMIGISPDRMPERLSSRQMRTQLMLRQSYLRGGVAVTMTRNDPADAHSDPPIEDRMA